MASLETETVVGAEGVRIKMYHDTKDRPDRAFLILEAQGGDAVDVMLTLRQVEAIRGDAGEIAASMRRFAGRA